TGASSGIGESLAYTFAKQKAKLILSARRTDELERVKKACNLPDADVMVLPMDVSEHNSMEAHVQKALAKFGQIDILVNNAGLSHWSKLKDTSFDVIKKIMDTNFMGGVALTKAVLPGMLQRKQGQIVVISSILGHIVTPKQGAYNASKHALHGFYDTLRAETKSEGVSVLLVCPGFVRTNVAKNSLNKEGAPIGKDNPLIANGLDPAYVAQQILSAINKGKEEIMLAGGKEKMAVYIKRFAPRLFSKFIANNKIV
ncbi:MAG TPA: SDR family oxidoreductase, partial [Chitinophagales bacterium]|nr:SDR family oxidoreductase [Chitinophagales bacterium]